MHHPLITVMTRPLTHALAIALTVVFAAGCGSRKYIDQPFRPIDLKAYETIRYWPPMGAETTAEIGDPMMRTLAVPTLPALQLPAPLVHITLYRDDLRMKLEVDRGVLELAGTDGLGGQFFAARGGLRLAYEAKGSFADPETLRGGVHLSAAGAKSMYWFWQDAKGASMVPAPPFQHRLSTVERPPKEARFRRELVYSGTAQSTLSVLYREFVDDFARPAFSQDLKYDLNRGSTIGYKGARFEVLSVGNTSITYKVLAPLERAAE